MTIRELMAAMAAAAAIFTVRRGVIMPGLEKIRILFIAGFGPIVRDTDASRKLYVKALEIPFKEESGGYLPTNSLQGAKEVALLPLFLAAESFFCTSTWPDNFPSPPPWL